MKNTSHEKQVCGLPITSVHSTLIYQLTPSQRTLTIINIQLRSKFSIRFGIISAVAMIKLGSVIILAGILEVSLLSFTSIQVDYLFKSCR